MAIAKGIRPIRFCLSNLTPSLLSGVVNSIAPAVPFYRVHLVEDADLKGDETIPAFGASFLRPKLLSARDPRGKHTVLACAPFRLLAKYIATSSDNWLL